MCIYQLAIRKGKYLSLFLGCLKSFAFKKVFISLLADGCNSIIGIPVIADVFINKFIEYVFRLKEIKLFSCKTGPNLAIWGPG